MGSRVERTHCNAAGPRELGQIVERMGQAVRPLTEPPAPHSHLDKLGGTAGDQNRLRNPGLQLREIKPQTSD